MTKWREVVRPMGALQGTLGPQTVCQEFIKKSASNGQRYPLVAFRHTPQAPAPLFQVPVGGLRDPAMACPRCFRLSALKVATLNFCTQC